MWNFCFVRLLESWENTAVRTPSPLQRAEWDLSFRKFHKKGGSEFSHKKGRVGKIEVVFLKKGAWLTNTTLPNPF